MSAEFCRREFHEFCKTGRKSDQRVGHRNTRKSFEHSWNELRMIRTGFGIALPCIWYTRQKRLSIVFANANRLSHIKSPSKFDRLLERADHDLTDGFNRDTSCCTVSLTLVATFIVRRCCLCGIHRFLQ